MKLKTLKDINFNSTPHGNFCNLDDVIICKKEDLKQAAQEWIDYIDNWDRNGRTYGDLKGFDRDIDFHYYHRELLLEWIKHFFNLEDTDEE